MALLRAQLSDGEEGRRRGRTAQKSRGRLPSSPSIYQVPVASAWNLSWLTEVSEQNVCVPAFRDGDSMSISDVF